MDCTQRPSKFRTSLHTLPYDRTVPEQAPIPIASPISEPCAEQSKTDHSSRPTHVSTKINLLPERDSRRDSGLACSSLRYSGASVNTADHSSQSLESKPSVPQIRIQGEGTLAPPSRRSEKAWLGLKSKKSIAEPPPPLEHSFQGIPLDIPSGALDLVDDLQPENMEFTKRGSILLGGRKVTEPSGLSTKHRQSALEGRRARSSPSLRKGPTTRILSTDEEMLSQKVRSYYDSGMDDPTGHGSSIMPGLERNELSQDACESAETSVGMKLVSDTPSEHLAGRKTSSRYPVRAFRREELELAGGLEDWQDIRSGDVDRYGFIMPRSSTVRSTTPGGMSRSPSTREQRSLQRISTSLQLAADAPRQKRTTKRSSSNIAGPSSYPLVNDSERQLGSKQLSRPASSQSSYQGGRNSRLRHATNRLPHNRNRRVMDRAGDMLTLPFASTDVVEKGEIKANGVRMRKKEIEREEKWHRMANIVSKRNDGGGTRFSFDTGSPKVIERTWKGIPDRWRATAWHAFLSVSAKKREESLTDERLMEMFHGYQDLASPDDVQIDIDVPRTISSHIMFRRRYRGGQRLLFRVLHAMSLHFPSTAYVQGMAAIAATLLAYYDEENAFVMLVRLWELRGLEKLYRAGFSGLMEALDDFQKRWLDGGDMSNQLTELGIPPTSYGTRWYLTLFNYSIPFPAQLRVWDVFMLLGGSEDVASPSSHANSHHTTCPPPSAQGSGNLGSTLDVLHATSAALIDGTRAILLESDFENAMKVLTSWVPIQDEDVFMRVAKAEWKIHRRKG